MEEYEDDYKEEVSSFGEEYDILLLEPFNGGKIGDIITVYRGMYNTLIHLKKGLPVDSYDDELTDSQRLVITIKNLEEHNGELMEENARLYDEVQQLKKQLNQENNNEESDPVEEF